MQQISKYVEKLQKNPEPDADVVVIPKYVLTE